MERQSWRLFGCGHSGVVSSFVVDCRYVLCIGRLGGGSPGRLFSCFLPPPRRLIFCGNRPQLPDLRAAAQKIVQIFHIGIQRGIHDVADRLLGLQVSVEEKGDLFGLAAVEPVNRGDDIGQG